MNKTPTFIALGIGSNLGDRQSHLQQAADEIKTHISGIKISGIYESDAMMLPNSPKEWDIKFLNIAISGSTYLTPDKLLETIKNIERKIGRNLNSPRWSPREIDIDILLYGDQNIKTNELIIPHKGLIDRQFFIMPLSEIKPDWQHKNPTTKNPFNTKIINTCLKQN